MGARGRERERQKGPGLYHPVNENKESSYSQMNTGASKSRMCGMRNGNADAVVHKATNY